MHDEQIEPPGTLAILGAGPLGLEAALYGRSLGYEVHIFEAGEVGGGLLREPNEFLPAPFGRRCSPLGLTALHTQDPQRELPHPELPLTHRDYIQLYLSPLAKTDLLSENIRVNTPVVKLESVPLDNDIPDEDAPPSDFRLVGVDGNELLIAECVIDATGATGKIEYPAASYDPKSALYPDLASGVPFLYRIGGRSDAKLEYLEGLEQIRRLFALLYGRESLDLYRSARF